MTETFELTDIEEEIIDFVKEAKKGKTFFEIKRFVKQFAIDEKEMQEILNNLEINGYLYLNDKSEYHLLSKFDNLMVGELKCNSKNKPYIVVNQNTIYIPDKNLNGAITGDIILVKRSPFDNGKGNKKIEVLKILKRSTNGIMFDYINGKFKPYNWPVSLDVKVPREQLTGLVEGSRVLITLSLEKKCNTYDGKIISLVGHKDDPQLDIKTIASSYGVSIEFSKKAMEQANAISDEVTEFDIRNRLLNRGLDLREKTIFTIDGSGTKDIDDAVSIEKKENGNYLLGVHIADVSYYVKENSVLDLEARERGTSIYPFTCVIPMLPHKLSNGICSLNPNVDRLAFSCIMEITPNGKIIDCGFYDTIINSKKKMCYEDVNDIFERHIEHEDYEPFIGDLALMMELSEILNAEKIKRGYISFGDNDVKFKDENGVAIEVKKRTRGMAEIMIENFMIAANEMAASFYSNLDMPGIYRTHPKPDVKSIEEAINSLNLNIHIPNNLDDAVKLQKVITKIRENDDSGICTEALLQSMKRAQYSTNNIKHFCLALDRYTHFTSPIRRYPDLATHRVIRAVRDHIMDVDTKKSKKELDEITKIANIRERTADKIEKEANHYKMAEYMEQHINETFTAYITCIGHNGLTIKTEDLIYGKIPMETLTQQGFKIDHSTNTLYNDDELILSIGDKIETTLTSSCKETGKIKFKFNKKFEKQKVLK